MPIETLPRPAPQRSATSAPAQPPLCIELDGVLTPSDLSVESLLGTLKRRPWLLPQMGLWRLSGRHQLSHELAERSEIDVSALPYNSTVVERVRQERAEGRRTVLVAGSNRKYAEQVARHLGIFDDVHASDEQNDLTDSGKAAKLREIYGDGGFEYVSDAEVEAPGASKRLKSWLKAMRVHQWAKNALLFIPLVTAHALLDWQAVLAVVIAFVSFGLCASATYIFNDLLDLDADRHHQKKKKRPFASGALSARDGLVGGILLLASGLGLSLLLPGLFQLALLAYIAVTLMYSFKLKRVASLDVLTLAGLYTLRVIAGAFAAGVALSFWLLAFSMFVFLCLALVKRVAELIELRNKLQLDSALTGKVRGREYSVEDIAILQTLGASSGYLAVLVLALYINSPDVAKLYATPQILWLIAPLMLLWVTRLWMVTTRGYMDEDPILFAVKDPETWITAAITGVILIFATIWSH